jgi:hypothetical protein
MARTDVVAREEVGGWLVTLLVAMALALLPLPAWSVDQLYSRTVYPMLQMWVTGISNLVPFSLLDFLVLTGAYLLLRRIVRLLGSIKSQGVLLVAWEGLRRLIRIASIVVIVFMVMWGLNYRRMPIDSAVGGRGTGVPSTEVLLAAMSDANVLASRLRDTKPVGMSFDAVADKLREPMNKALLQLDRTTLRQPGRPKYSLILTPFFTWTGVDGMIDPLALEAIVHPDLLPYERPFALAHEWAHLAGMADEAEASAVGWLACMNGEPQLAYSASLYLIREASVALPPELRQSATDRLDPGVLSDLNVIAERLQQEHPGMQRAATRVYDEYLKANRVQDGAASYGRALTLILNPPIHDALINYRFGRAVVR